MTGLATPRVVAVTRLIGYVGCVALVGWVALVAVRDVNWSRIDWRPLVPAAALILAWWLLLARGWSVLQTGSPDRAAAALWFRTQALRYLPGGIWAPVSRVAAVGGTATDRVGTVVTENLVALSAGAAVAGVALAVAGRPEFAPLVLAPVAPLLLVRLLGARTRLTSGTVAEAAALNLAAFAAYGGGAVLAQDAVGGMPDLWLIAGAAGLAWAAGLVVVVAPGGVGVREATYVALLAGTLPRGEAAGGAVTLRLLTIAVELAILAVAGRPPRPRPPDRPTPEPRPPHRA